MRRGLPLQKATSLELRRLQEAGLLQEWQARDVSRFGDQADYRSRTPGLQQAALGVNNLAGAFAFLLIGLTAGGLVFALEIIFRKTDVDKLIILMAT
jgi:hypothetical protein